MKCTHNLKIYQTVYKNNKNFRFIYNKPNLSPLNYEKLTEKDKPLQDVYIFFGEKVKKSCKGLENDNNLLSSITGKKTQEINYQTAVIPLELNVCSKVPVLLKQFKNEKDEISKDFEIDMHLKPGNYIIGGKEDSFLFDESILFKAANSSFSPNTSYPLRLNIDKSNFINETTLLNKLSKERNYCGLKIQNPEFLFDIVCERKNAKEILMQLLYGAGIKGTRQKIMEVINDNRKELTENLYFTINNNTDKKYFLKDYPYLGFTEKTINNLVEKILYTFRLEFPDIFSVIEINKALGAICLFNNKPVIISLFNKSGGGKIGYNLEFIQKEVLKKKTQLNFESTNPYDYDIPGFNTTEIPVEFVEPEIIIAVPADVTHHIDGQINLEVLLLEHVYSCHDAWASCVTHGSFVEAYYKSALSDLQKIETIKKLLIMNLKQFCPNIEEVLNAIDKNSNQVSLSNVSFPLIFICKKGDKKGERVISETIPDQENRSPREKCIKFYGNLDFSIDDLNLSKFHNTTITTKAIKMEIPSNLIVKLHPNLLNQELLKEREFSIYKKKEPDLIIHDRQKSLDKYLDFMFFNFHILFKYYIFLQKEFLSKRTHFNIGSNPVSC